MLVCRCGWTGVNLVPNYGKGTAQCPGCGVAFRGIPANRAILMGREEERLIIAGHLVAAGTATAPDTNRK